MSKLSFEMYLTDYPVDVYREFEKAVGGSQDAFHKLLDEGYPEWAAFSNGILGDEKAVWWLLKNGYPEMGVLANGIDDEPAALDWLRRYPDPLLYSFCQATKGDRAAKDWLEKQNLIVFLILAEAIRKAMRLRIKREIFWYKIKW